MYPEYLVAPMREELTRVGFEELKDANAVNQAIESNGTVFVMVNSVCGCAAANARPAARIAAQNGKHPGKLVHMIERHQIEGRPAQMIADNLIGAFDQYC